MTVPPAHGSDVSTSSVGLQTADDAYREAMRLNEDGRPAEAIALLEAVLALDATHEDAAIELGVTLMDIGQTEAAIDRLEQALHDHPTMDRARMALGNCLMRSGSLERAIGELETCIEHRPTWDAPYPPLIRALCRLSRVGEARAKLAALRELGADAPQFAMLEKLIDRTARSAHIA
jgi:tetratricopeptide (TPR) repeat protein